MSDLLDIVENLAIASGTAYPPYYVYNTLTSSDETTTDKNKSNTERWNNGEALGAAIVTSFFSYSISKLTVKELKKLFESLTETEHDKKCREKRKRKRKSNKKSSVH